MKNTQPLLFSTGICDTTHSKRTIVSLMKGLRLHIPSPLYVISNHTIKKEWFSDMYNERGCFYLSGAEVEGQSLYSLYCAFNSDSFKDKGAASFLRYTVSLIDTAMIFNSTHETFPPLLLNSIYISDNGRTFTYLPSPLIDYLNTFLDDDMRKISYYPIAHGGAIQNPLESGMRIAPSVNTIDQFHFSHMLARLIYLFFTKNTRITDAGTEQNVYSNRLYYVKTEMRDVPDRLADMLWNILHGKQIHPAQLKRVLIESLNAESDHGTSDRVPLSRRRSVISFKAGFTAFLGRRWKLLLIALVLVGIAFYLLSDAVLSQKRIDPTAGLDPIQVVELYFEAVNTLDLNYLDAIYYKRSGKRVKDELSTVYVMLKMESAFGKARFHPDDIEIGGFDPERDSVYGISDLELEQLENDATPIYKASYKRIISSGEMLYETAMEETIQLQFIDDHWYITESERVILSEGPYMRDTK
jgi:hypothetical protein